MNLIGNKITFPKGNNIFYRKDFRSFNEIPSNVVFTVIKKVSYGSDFYWLSGNGFGKNGNYGNGLITVHEDDIANCVKQATCQSFDLKNAFEELFDKASRIQHWYDALYNKTTGECEGVVVSKEHQAELMETINKYRDFRESL